MKKIPQKKHCWALGLATLVLAGCGGSGGGGSNPSNHEARLQIEWGARSRAVVAPSSALSATITLTGAAPSGGNLVQTVNRRADPAAYSQTYDIGEARDEHHSLTVRFYAGANGTGDVVAVATGTLNHDGTTTVTTTRTIQSVTVAPDQGVPAGQVADLTFTARDKDGALVAVTPGSAFWSVTEGDAILHVDADGTATGLTRGFAQVRATVDGVASTPVAVKVDADPTGATATLNFDDLPAVDYIAGTDVTPEARLSDRYRTTHGISFRSGSSYASVVRMRDGETPSAPNALTGATLDDKVTYDRANAVTFTFFDPLAPSEKGRTRTFSLSTDRVGFAAQNVRIEAYDAAGNLIGSDEKPDADGVTLTVSFDTPRIHRVVFLGSPENSNGVAVDDVTFAPVIPAEAP